MLIRLALLCLLSLPTNTAAKTNQGPMNESKQNQSAEVSSLTAEDTKLKNDITNLQNAENRWNASNRWLSFLAVGVGALFGIGAFFAQRTASAKSLDVQPLLQRRERIAEQLHLILDQEYRAEIARAGQAASDAQQNAATANNQAQQAILEQARLNNANLELQQSIERERTARIQLLQTLAYRTLNSGELGKLRAATYRYRTVQLDILYVATKDYEARAFAARMNAAFDIWKPNLFAINDAGQPGLSVEYNPNDPLASEAAQHFFDALDHHGFRVNGPFPSLPYTPPDLLTAGKPKASLRLVVGERDPVYLPPEMRK